MDFCSSKCFLRYSRYKPLNVIALMETGFRFPSLLSEYLHTLRRCSFYCSEHRTRTIWRDTYMTSLLLEEAFGHFVLSFQDSSEFTSKEDPSSHFLRLCSWLAHFFRHIFWMLAAQSGRAMFIVTFWRPIINSVFMASLKDWLGWVLWSGSQPPFSNFATLFEISSSITILETAMSRAFNCCLWSFSISVDVFRIFVEQSGIRIRFWNPALDFSFTVHVSDLSWHAHRV